MNLLQPTLSRLKERLQTVLEQINNEQLTGDSHTDYKIRMQTNDLYHERNVLKQQAWTDFEVKL